MRHHLVVLHEAYLRLILAGRKRVECRLSSVERPPFDCVSRGDLLWFKPPSQPVRAVAVVARCEFVRLTRAGDLTTLLAQYAADIRAADGFFNGAERWARYCTLVCLGSVVAIEPLRVHKSDQRAWVVLDGYPRPGMKIAADAQAGVRTWSRSATSRYSRSLHRFTRPL